MVQTGPTSTSAVVQTGPTGILAENLKTADRNHSEYKIPNSQHGSFKRTHQFCVLLLLFFLFRKGHGHLYGVIFKNYFVVVDDFDNFFSSHVQRTIFSLSLYPTVAKLPFAGINIYINMWVSI